MSDESIMANTVFGQVVNVRPVLARGVTQVIIEIPGEFHVSCTNMLFGKDAFILAAMPGVSKPYGLHPLSSIGEDSPPVDASEMTDGMAPAKGTSVRIGNGLTRIVNIGQWLGQQCQSAAFMNWLGVTTSSTAIEKVRDICGVTSRSEIAKNPNSVAKFGLQIYGPFLRYSVESKELP